MMFRYIITCLFVLAGISCWAQTGISEKTGTSLRPEALVFKLKPQYLQLATPAGVASAPLEEALKTIGAYNLKQKFPRAEEPTREKEGAVDLRLLYEIRYNAKIPLSKAIQAIEATGMVEYAEPLYVREVLFQPNDPFADSVSGSQYHLKSINAYNGWNVETGDSSIVIGVVDTGFGLNHEDLAGQIKLNYADPIDGIDNDNDGYIDNFYGWDLADEDNNPHYDVAGYWHGALVAGASSATPNNSKGGAGVGFYCRYLPIKAYPTTPTGHFAGFEGVVYAADHGCQVINLSWGGPGYPSRFEQDVINYAAINKNAVIVAAAGNTNGLLDFYPASYDNVISVAALEANDLKGTNNTYSYTVDISAPGKQIMTTWVINDSSYASVGGSSFAAPLVSGCAALVIKKFPNYSSQQVAERLRATAQTSIYSLPGNSQYQEMLGKGKVDLFRALNDPNVKSVRNTRNTFTNGRNIYPGDTVRIIGEFKNYLSPMGNLSVTLSSPSPYVTVKQATFNAGAMATMATARNKNQPFEIVIAPNTPINTELVLRYGFTDGAYTDFQHFKIIVNPDYLTIDINELDVTVTSRGNLGYNGNNYWQGIGIRYKNSASLLPEAGLLIGADNNRVSNSVRAFNGNLAQNFYATQPVKVIPNSRLADMVAQTVLQDSVPSAGTIGVRVTQNAYAWTSAPYDKFVILEYKITNLTNDTLHQLKAGIFADWDILNYSRNRAGWDSTLALGYAHNTASNSIFAGIKVLTENPAYYAIDNFNPPQGTINISDGFSNPEKYMALSGGVQRKTAGMAVGGADISHVVGASVPKIGPGQTATVAFAIIGGDSLDDLRNSALAAQIKYRTLLAGQPPLVQNDTICRGSSSTITPTGGTTFKYYSDSRAKTLLGTGSTFNTGTLTKTKIFYITNADSAIESSPTPVAVVVSQPESRFSVSPDTISLQAGGVATFQDKSSGAVQWSWNFGDGSRSTSQNPTHTYQQTGNFPVTLIITDKFGCSDTLMQQVVVKTVTGLPADVSKSILLYPNPVQNLLHIQLPVTLIPSEGLQMELFNNVGARVLTERLESAESQLDLRQLSRGIYVLKLHTTRGTYVTKVQVLH